MINLYEPEYKIPFNKYAVFELEENIASMCHARYCVTFSSATAALLSLSYISRDYCDKVQMPAIHFSGIYSAMRRAGFNDFEFVDCKQDSGVASQYQKRDRCLYLVHHLGAHVASNFCFNHDSSFVIEDGCHAFGALYGDGPHYGYPVGSCIYSDATVFSFDRAKTLCALEGGAVTTNNETIYKALRRICDLGREEGTGLPQSSFLGLNFKMSPLIAQVLCDQILSGGTRVAINSRRDKANLYRSFLKERGVSFQKATEFSSGHLMIALIDKRDEYIKQAQHGFGIHYEVHSHVLSQQLKGFDGSLSFSSRAISLPLWSGIKDESIEKVCDLIYSFKQG